MKKEYKGFMPGDKILIKKINDKRKDLEGKEAVIQFIDDAGQLHIDITSVALIPGIDEIKLIAGTRNGNMIFACSLSKTGYITFRRTTYTCDGTPAIVYYKTDASGSIQICDSGISRQDIIAGLQICLGRKIIMDQALIQITKRWNRHLKLLKQMPELEDILLPFPVISAAALLVETGHMY